MIPSFADIRRENQLPLNAVRLSEYLALLEGSKSQINLVVVDACRNNNLPTSERGIGRGLAKVEAPEGTLIAFATSPGKVAEDGEGNNSPYAQALAAAIRTPGITVEETFKRARKQVRANTGKQQTPWDQTSLDGEFFFFPVK